MSERPQPTRRDILKKGAALSAGMFAGAALPRTLSAASRTDTQERKGRIRQGLVSWTYMDFGDKWSLEELCQVRYELGCEGMGTLGPDDWPTLHEHGLICSLSTNGMPAPPFLKGLNNPRYQEEVISRTRRRIEECAEAGVPNVIAFTGFSHRDVERPELGMIPDDEGAANTVAGLKELALHAERHDVTICVEHLNSTVPNDDVRGHPAYQGDHSDSCADIPRQVGPSPVKLP